jgi:hypothetical protein
MAASERPAPSPKGSGLPEDCPAATKPLELFGAHRTARTDHSVGQQLRRRRQDSYRCEPMADGRRDPLEKRNYGRNVVWVEVGPKNSTAVTGDRVFVAVKKLEIPYQWHPFRQAVLCIPTSLADDLISYLEHRCRRRVEVVAVERI